VSGFEAGVGANSGIGAKRISSGGFDVGSQSLTPMATIGRAHVARADGAGSLRVMAWLAPPMRLVLPVLVLLALGLASLAYGRVNASWLAPFGGGWLSVGLAVLPVSFFAIHLTGRRYGAAYALWQVVFAWLVGAGALMLAKVDPTIPAAPLPMAPREMTSFAFGLFFAQLVAVFVFDRLRGPRWWKAPLFASLFAGVVLSLVAFPAAYAGTPVDWTGRMADYLGYAAAASLLLLIPYWMLRAAVPPQSGFGGY